jgi:hypothetical protein
MHETLRLARLKELPRLIEGQVAIVGRLQLRLLGGPSSESIAAREDLPANAEALTRLATEWSELLREQIGGTHKGAVVKWYTQNPGAAEARWTLYLSCGHTQQRTSMIAYGRDNTPRLAEVVTCSVARGERNQIVDAEVDRYREAAERGLVPALPSL